MQIPTGDCLIEFVDYKGVPLDDGVFLVASYEEAHHRAESLRHVFGGSQYRIMRCLFNSSDPVKERWG